MRYSYTNLKFYNFRRVLWIASSLCTSSLVFGRLRVWFNIFLEGDCFVRLFVDDLLVDGFGLLIFLLIDSLGVNKLMVI